MDPKKNHYLVKPLLLLIPILIVLMLITFPQFTAHHSTLSPLNFKITQRIEKDNKLILQGNFDTHIKENENIWLYAENAKIAIKVNDVHMTCNTLKNTPSMFRSAGSGWFSLRSPNIKANDMVVFTIESYYGENEYAKNALIDNLAYGDGAGLYHKALSHIDFFGLVLLFTTFSGLIFLLEGVIYLLMGMSKEGSRIAIFGFYCFSGSLWCVTDIIYPYLSLLITPPWIINLFDMMGMLLFPISLASLMLYSIKGKHTKRFIQIIFTTEILLAILCILFQLFGLIDLFKQQVIIGFVSIISLIVAMICIMIELKQQRDNYLVLLFFTVLPVFITSLLDSVNILYPFMPRRFLMQYGFSLSAILLLLQLVRYANDGLEKEKTLHLLESELEDARISIMLSQIQPHFLYNALSGIKQLTDINPRKASEALEHFSYYLTRNLDSLINRYLIPFMREMEHVQDYLYLEKMRFPETIQVDFDLQYEHFSIPPLSVQSLVENAIRYGITKKKGGGTLLIRSEVIDNYVIITIQDDGVGFDLNSPIKDGKTHTGIQNVSHRLKIQCRGHLHIQSEINVGTKVTLKIPLKEEPI